jgi:hypothetical protein
MSIDGEGEHCSPSRVSRRAKTSSKRTEHVLLHDLTTETPRQASGPDTALVAYQQPESEKVSVAFARRDVTTCGTFRLQSSKVLRPRNCIPEIRKTSYQVAEHFSRLT